MTERTAIVYLVSASLGALNATPAPGQFFPGKPIRIVTSQAGGGTDFAARIVAQGLTDGLGQQVIVDNRGALSAVEAVSKSAPDGYVLLVSGSTFLFAPLLGNATYDPVRDFSAISILAMAPSVLAIHPSLPVKSIKQLIALARNVPGELNYASGPSGSILHLAMELFKSMAKVDIMRIPYKGTAPALNDLISGRVHIMVANASGVSPYIRSGRLNAVAVTSLQPSALAPGLPTVAESGLPGYEVTSLDAIFAPAKTPSAIINRLNEETVRVMNRPDVKRKFLESGEETVGSSPEDLITRIKSEMATWSKLIKSAEIRSD